MSFSHVEQAKRNTALYNQVGSGHQHRYEKEGSYCSKSATLSKTRCLCAEGLDPYTIGLLLLKRWRNLHT